MEDNFQQILKILQPQLNKVNQIILEFSDSKSPLTKEIAQHLISSGGKRIRPILLILSANLCGYQNGDDHIKLAGAVELIHSATLLHDDVVDESKLRRGKKTANAIWDNKASILVGDYLFSIAFQLMTKSNNLKILDLLAKTSSIMADGEVMQLENSNNVEISKEKYFEIIFGKTAVLFSSACEVGAILTNRAENEIVALRNFGKNLGIIFQIVDDVLDYLASEDNIGKAIGDDFFEGKVTLPIIFAYEKADKTDKQTISDLFFDNFKTENNEKSPESLEKILQLLEKYKAIDATLEMAEKTRLEAISNLAIFQDSESKNQLITILNYALKRIK